MAFSDKAILRNALTKIMRVKTLADVKNVEYELKAMCEQDDIDAVENAVRKMEENDLSANS